MDQKEDKRIRELLIKNIQGGQAFMTIEEMVEKIPFNKLHEKPDKLPYSFYQVFYHIRQAQKDILDYSTSADYQAPEWPDDYWPEKQGPENEEDWKTLTKDYFKEREDFCNTIADTKNDLLAPFSKENEHNLLREAELIIAHNAYHTGQLLLILRLLSVYH